MSSLRTAALGPWAEADPVLKAQATLALDLHAPVRAAEMLRLKTPCSIETRAYGSSCLVYLGQAT